MFPKFVKRVEFPSDIFIFSLFAIYSIVFAPDLTQFLSFGSTNYFVGFFGIFIYVIEHFAFKYKMYVIRLRAEHMRIQLREQVNEKTRLPSVGAVVWIGIVFRMFMRAAMLSISIAALRETSIQVYDMKSGGLSLWFLFLFPEFALTVYLMVTSNFFNPYPYKQFEIEKEIRDSDKWADRELNKPHDGFILKELLSDIVLQIYSFMLFTALWDMINRTAIKMTENSFKAGHSAFDAGLNVFAMLFFLVIFALPALRLAYWIEGYATAFNDKDRWRTRLTFVIAAVVTIAPTIGCYFRLYFSK